jgi:hypothetical protein
MAGLSIACTVPKLAKKYIFFRGVNDPPDMPEVFLHLKMLKSAPKYPKLIPEVIRLSFSSRNSD